MAGLLAAVLLAALILSQQVPAYASESSENAGFSVILDSLKEAAQDLAEAAGDVYNILLIGVDRRDSSWNGNSDTMMLVSVNRSSKKVTIMSFMRDLYADIEGYGVRKLNAACAVGGPSLLVSTLKSNYGIDINNYACADFNTMIDLVDALGGVEITLSDAEAESANGSIREMANLRGEDPDSHYLSGGTHNCDGLQTVAYARIRHIGNNDYERTERQREVISQLVRKISSYSAEDLASFMNTALSIIRNDLTNTDILSLAAWAPEILTYERTESRIPYDGLYYSQDEILVPTQPDTNNRIHEELYG